MLIDLVSGVTIEGPYKEVKKELDRRIKKYTSGGVGGSKRFKHNEDAIEVEVICKGFDYIIRRKEDNKNEI